MIECICVDGDVFISSLAQVCNYGVALAPPNILLSIKYRVCVCVRVLYLHTYPICVYMLMDMYLCRQAVCT